MMTKKNFVTVEILIKSLTKMQDRFLNVQISMFYSMLGTVDYLYRALHEKGLIDNEFDEVFEKAKTLVESNLDNYKKELYDFNEVKEMLDGLGLDLTNKEGGQKDGKEI